MPWGRLDDQLHDKAKVSALSDKAFRTWVYSLSYCNKKRIQDPQGHLTEVEARDLCHRAKALTKGAVASVIKELTTLREESDPPSAFWEPAGRGFVIHDFAEFGPKSDPTAAERMRNYRNAHRNENRNAVTESPHGRARPVPVPIPNQVEANASPEPPAASEIRPVPKSEQSVPIPHREMIAALGKSFGAASTKSGWGMYAAAAKELIGVGAEPEDIPRLYERWDELYPGATCTPTALVKHYGALNSDRKRSNGKANGQVPESWHGLRNVIDRRRAAERSQPALEGA